jgi:hypothetical protein
MLVLKSIVSLVSWSMTFRLNSSPLFPTMRGPGACPLTRTALHPDQDWISWEDEETHCRVNPSGAMSPLVSVISAVGPMDARAEEIRHVARKSGEKDMSNQKGGKKRIREKYWLSAN